MRLSFTMSLLAMSFGDRF